MALRIEGRVTQITPIESGEGQRGPWKKRLLIIDTLDQFPRRIAFTVWNDRAEALDNLGTGQRVVVDFSVESREYNGRWYTDAKAFAIKVVKEEDVVGGSSANRPSTNATGIPGDESSEDQLGTQDEAGLYNDLRDDDDNDFSSDSAEDEDFFGDDDNATDDLPF